MKADNKLASTGKSQTLKNTSNLTLTTALQHKRNLQPNAINEYKSSDIYKAQGNPKWHFPAAILTHSYTFVCHVAEENNYC